LEQFFNFLSTYLVSDIVTNIVCYYDQPATSLPIPKTYLMRFLLAQIGENVALELHTFFEVQAMYLM